ncbi:hypothetical protein FRC09_009086, partial [Ceratobasidium sp. 395]
MPVSELLFGGLVAFLIAAVAYNVWYRKVPERPLPPSPRSYPLIGHLLSMPTEYEHFGFVELGKQLN